MNHDIKERQVNRKKILYFNETCFFKKIIDKTRDLRLQRFRVVRYSSGNTLVHHSRGPRFNSWPGHWKFQKCFKCFPPN